MKPHQPIPLVLCEGKEDRLVMEMLAKAAGLEGRLEFQDYGGESKLRPYLANLRVSPEFRRGEYSRILITRDADTDYEGAWTSVRDSIRAVFSCDVGAAGDWVSPEVGVQIAAWIIPGPGKKGMIETLCLDASRSQSPELFSCLDPFVECLAKLNQGTPHEKVRFALWTIIAQGAGAKDRLSFDRALAKLPLDWSGEVFAPLRKVLTDLSAGTSMEH
jgi:hypothetical protein